MEKNETLILADSNVYIELLRAGKDPAEVLLEGYGSPDLVTCGMVKLEVLRGVRRRAIFERLSEFFGLQRWVESSFDDWQDTVDLARELARQGVTLPATDLVIATAAFRTGASVLTADKHFSLIPGLPVIPSPF